MISLLSNVTVWHTLFFKKSPRFIKRPGRWHRMFFIILGTYTWWTFILFSLAQRILLLIFQCHTVTHGTDLRRSPLLWEGYETALWWLLKLYHDPDLRCRQAYSTADIESCLFNTASYILIESQLYSQAISW